MNVERSCTVAGTKMGGVLTAEQAIEIYRVKISAQGSQADQGCIATHKFRGCSTPLAERYGVSPKAIRDIWNRRTWAFVTLKLWPEEQPGLVRIESSGSSIKVKNRQHFALRSVAQYLTALSPQVNGVEIRQCRGRPKGSRDKKPRARKADQSPIPITNPVHFADPSAFPSPTDTTGIPAQGLHLQGRASALHTWAMPRSACMSRDACPVLQPDEAQALSSTIVAWPLPPFPSLPHALDGGDASRGGGALSAALTCGGDWSAFPCAGAAPAPQRHDSADPFYGDYPFW
jgi:hypothetical protein